MDPVRNFAIATVSGGYNEHATTIVLAAGQGAKFPEFFGEIERAKKES